MTLHMTAWCRPITTSNCNHKFISVNNYSATGYYHSCSSSSILNYTHLRVELCFKLQTIEFLVENVTFIIDYRWTFKIDYQKKHWNLIQLLTNPVNSNWMRWDRSSDCRTYSIQLMQTLNYSLKCAFNLHGISLKVLSTWIFLLENLNFYLWTLTFFTKYLLNRYFSKSKIHLCFTKRILNFLFLIKTEAFWTNTKRIKEFKV